MNCWIILFLLCRMNGQGGFGCGNGGLMGACQGNCNSEGANGLNAVPGMTCGMNSMSEPPCSMNTMPETTCGMNGNAADGCGCGETPGVNRSFPSF